MKRSEGQNLIEYVLLVAAVLLVCIYFFTAGPMKQSVNTGLNSVINQLNNLNSQIQLQ